MFRRAKFISIWPDKRRVITPPEKPKPVENLIPLDFAIYLQRNFDAILEDFRDK